VDLIKKSVDATNPKIDVRKVQRPLSTRSANSPSCVASCQYKTDAHTACSPKDSQQQTNGDEYDRRANRTREAVRGNIAIDIPGTFI
jgi:hypothetical protein